MSEENVYQSPTSDLMEGLEEEMVYAGFWMRVAASILDSLLSMLVTLPLLTMIYGLNYWTSELIIHGFWDAMISYVFPAIAIVLFWVFKSATPGKMLLKLQVVSLKDSKKLTVGQAVVRYIGYIPSILVFFIGFIWVAFDPKKQGWHDKMANTAVIKKMP